MQEGPWELLKIDLQKEEIIQYCLGKKEAYVDYPFGDIPICFKVKNKLFAQLYPLDNDYKITLKCDVLLAEIYRKQYKY